MEQALDKGKTTQRIDKGRRAKWWLRTGSKASGFKYKDASGKKISDKALLERIRSLVIPPAWKDVRICPSQKGRVQAVGVDVGGRIQYLYDPSFTEKQKRKKFAKIEKFGKYLPKLIQATNKDLLLEGLPKERVLAVVMRLINSLYFRIGTNHSEEHYKTYGITTLHKKHLTIGRKGKLEFDFVGKSHIQHRKILVDEELAAIVKEIASIGRGRKLFRYLDENGKPHSVTPSQVNSYLKSNTDQQFSSKDFRTWRGTVLAAVELAEIGPGSSESETKKNIVQAVKKVAEELGNTPAVCRGSYIHPAVLEAYESGKTLEHFGHRRSRSIHGIQKGLEPEEVALMKLFEKA
jgi:Topoisomerase IB